MQSCRTAQQATSQAENGRRKATWSVSEESVVRSRAKAQRKLLELAQQSPNSTQQARAMADAQAQVAAEMEIKAVYVDMMQLKPGEFNKLENVLARELGVHRVGLGLGDDLTQAGAVKGDLVEMQRHAKGLVDVAGRWATIKGQREAIAVAEAELAKVGVKGGAAKEFIDNVLQVADSPRLRLAYGNTPANNQVLSRRHNAMVEEARKLGLSEAALDNIMVHANEAAGVWDKMRVIGNLLGQDIGVVENLGYTYRQFTDKAKRFFDLKNIDTNAVLNPGVGSTPMAQSRSTWQLTPTDMQALAEVLTGKGVKSWDARVKELMTEGGKLDADAEVTRLLLLREQARDTFKQARDNFNKKNGVVTLGQVQARARDLKAANNEVKVARAVYNKNKSGSGLLSYSKILAKAGGDDKAAMAIVAEELRRPITEVESIRRTHDAETNAAFTELTDLWNDGLKFTEHLNNKVSAQQLDDLVDAGILSKVPMTTREVYDYMSRQYQLPWSKKGVQDIFEMDIEKRTNAYREKLGQAAGQSYMVQNIVQEGTAKGWAVPTSELLPTEHAGFKELSGIDVTRYGIDPKVAASWGGMHVHPTVYNQLQAQLAMMTKPGVLSAVGQVLLYVNKNFNIITLGGNGVPFLSRNILGGMRTGVAAGMNPLRTVPAFHEMGRVLKDGTGVLDDVGDFMKVDGKWLTKKAAFEQFMMRSGGSYVGAESGQALGFGVKQTAAKRIASFALDVGASLPRAIFDMQEYAAMHPDFISGLVGAAKLGTKQFDDYVSRVFAPIAYGNALSDMALQWATLTSVMEVKGVQDNVRRGLQLVSDNHSFNNFDDAFAHLRNYFIDHASLGRIPQAIAKYVKPFGTFAMLSPALALRHAVRNPAQFVAYSRLVRMQAENYQRDPDMREAGFSEFELQDMPITLFKDPDGKSVLTLSPSNWDSFHGSAVYGLTQIQRLARLRGDKSITFGAQDRKELRGDKYSFIDFVGDNIRENNNPLFAAAAELITGQDKYKRDIDKVPVEIGGAKVDPNVGWFLSKLPGFSAFNRNLGGRGKVVDSTGKTLSPAKPGIFGTPDRVATTTENSNYETGRRLGTEQTAVLRDFLGLNVKTIDLAKGRQHTLTDVRTTIRELDKQARKLYDTVEPSPQRTKDIELLQNQALQMSVDAYRVQKWMKRHNVAEGEALREMDRLSIRVRSVKITTPEMDGFIRKSFVLGQPQQ